MNFVIIITARPYASQGGHSAYHFSLALLDKGYTISQIFFYGDASWQQLPVDATTDETQNLYPAWQQLQQKHQLSLHLCQTSAQARGVHEPEQQSGLIRVSSLAQLAKAIANADRVLTFG